MAISKKLLNPGETVVISTRQHVKALIVPVLALIVFLAIGVVVQVAVDVQAVTWVVWVLCAVAIVWWTVRPFLTWLTTVHAFTDRRLITRWGILNKVGKDLPLLRINDVSYERSLVDRMFGCGTLNIQTAADAGATVLDDVPDVERVHVVMTELLFGTGGHEPEPPDPKSDT